jgi:hypothetical protein
LVSIKAHADQRLLNRIVLESASATSTDVRKQCRITIEARRSLSFRDASVAVNRLGLNLTLMPG